MRLLRAILVALLTAAAGCVLSFFVGDYLTETRAGPPQGRRARHDYRLFVRPSWNFGGFSNRNRLSCPGPSAKTCRISYCTGLVASRGLYDCRIVSRHSLFALR